MPVDTDCIAFSVAINQSKAAKRGTFAALAFALALAAGAALAAAILLCKNLVVVSRKFWLSSTVRVVPGAAKRNRVSQNLAGQRGFG